MRRKFGITDSEDPRAIRLAWWASFFATVMLIALLGVARSAQALTSPGAAGPTTSAISLPVEEGESEAEGEEEEFEAEECEAEEEGEEEECIAEEAAAEASEECVLSSASASVSASLASDKVRLSIHYTAFSPGSVEVLYWLRGSKGPLSLGREKDRLGRKGVLRQTEILTAAQMTKAAAAKSFTVQLRPANAPRYCHSLLDRHLTIRHATAGRLTWSDPEMDYRFSRQP